MFFLLCRKLFSWLKRAFEAVTFQKNIFQFRGHIKGYFINAYEIYDDLLYSVMKCWMSSNISQMFILKMSGTNGE